MSKKYKIYDEVAFYEAFARDLKAAKALVLIQSPFIAARRIEKLKYLITDGASRRVRFCIFIQRPSKRQSKQSYEAHVSSIEKVADTLRSMDVHVNFRDSIHEKLAVIDDRVFWEGSLNILSHNDTSERMTRWTDPTMIEHAINEHGLNSCSKCQPHSFSLQLPNAQPEVDQLRAMGATIARRRKKLRISQSSLAAQVGLLQPVVSDIESGKPGVGMGRVLLICNCLRLELRPIPWHLLPLIDELINDETPGE